MTEIFQLTVPTPFKVGDTHIYLLKGDTLSLIDAGVKTEEAWIVLTDQLRELGFQASDIEQIILTHHHPDHIGLINKFPCATITAHPYVHLWITRDEGFLDHYEEFYKQILIRTGVPKQLHTMIDQMRLSLQFAGEGELSSTLHEGDVLPGHDDWKVIETRGHAQSHLSFFREKDGFFIGGDHLLYHTSPNPLLEPPYYDQTERAKPLLQYRTNLKKCLSLGIKRVLPGHGPYFSSVESYVNLQFKNQEKRAQKILELIQHSAQTPFQICQQLFPKHYKQQLELTMSQTIGLLDLLKKHEKLHSFMDQGVHFYRVK